MRIKLKTNEYKHYGTERGDIVEVLLTYPRDESKNDIIYLTPIPLGAMYHYEDHKKYQIISKAYLKNKHMGSEYGWLAPHEFEFIEEVKNNQQALLFLKRSE